ncbi:MAG: right-handed parallel beta-helix repeat-containing protein, partial [Myxococcota bacterium]
VSTGFALTTGGLDTASFLIDGTEFSYFDAGGVERRGFGISAPFVSGLSSTEWGATPELSVAYDLTDKLLTAEYVGLSTLNRYELLLVYVNQDPGSSTQRLTDLAGREIHRSFTLPGQPLFVDAPVPGESVSGGVLSMKLRAEAGLRAVVSILYLLQGRSDDIVSPLVSVGQPANGALLPGGIHLVNGSASDAGSDLRSVEVSLEPLGSPPVWRPVSTLSASGDWSYLWSSPASGAYEIRARATDRAGNVGLSSTVQVAVNAAAPAPATDVRVEEIAGLFRILWLLSEDDGAGDDDVDRYEIYRRDASSPVFLFVGQATAGQSSFDDAAVTTGVDYSYKVTAVDVVGNRSDSATAGPARLSGLADTTPPEDVTGLTATATSLNGTGISAYLTWTGSADTAGDLVGHRLRVSTDGGVTFGTNAPAFDDGGIFTIPRHLTRFQVGTLTAGVTHHFTLSTIDEVPNESAGVTVSLTPTGAPSEVVSISGTLPVGVTTLLPGVYSIPSTLTIPDGSMLQLASGTIFKFAPGRQLLVGGQLIVQGTAALPVVFTALADDEWGGDTNGDGVSAGAPGAWTNIHVQMGASASFAHAVVRYAGASGANVLNDRGVTSLFKTEIIDGASEGVHSLDGSLTIRGSTISRNGSWGVRIRSRFGGGSGFALEGSTLSQNGGGIRVENYAVIIDGNQIIDNASWGILFTGSGPTPPPVNNVVTGNVNVVAVPASGIPDDTNVLTPNVNPYIQIQGGSTAGSARLRIWAPGSPEQLDTYRFCTTDTTVPLGSFLLMDPGVVLKFCNGIGISVDGALVAEGTSDDKIVFTSDDDPEFGWDLRATSTTLPANGDWDGLRFNDSLFEDSSLLRHAVVRYGGANGSGNVYANGAEIRVEDSEISHSSSHGVRVWAASPQISGNRIWGNTLDGARIERAGANPTITFNRFSSNGGDGAEVVSPANAILSNNQFFTNRGFGLRNGSASVIDATQSWWGETDGSGPQNTASNPAGTGERVSDNVDFSFFQTTPPFDYSYANFEEAGISTEGGLPGPTLVQGTLTDEWDPVSKRSDRTIAGHPDEVEVAYAGLDPGKRYVARISYFNGDPSASFQSLVDGAGDPVHGSFLMPTTPTQLEVAIPQAYYATGNLSLRFLNDNPATSFRAALPELWVIEDVLDLTPPRFTAARYNDRDGSGDLSIGDEFRFEFSESMNTGLIVSG